VIRAIYRTATSFNGYIADEDHSLAWLFAVDQDGAADHEAFLATVGVIVEGSSTYEWVLRETDMLAHPDRWQQYYGTRPTFVFTSRDLVAPAGADVRFCSGPVADHLQEIRDAAGRDAAEGGAAEGDAVWIVGGGDVAGQFLDIGALDEIVLTVAPVALAGGAPLLPRVAGSDRLTLITVLRRGQFVDLTYAVAP
jgi:dihydrofolate reductase